MQARADAMDEVIQSGTLQEIGPGAQDDLEHQFAGISQSGQQAEVDKELAAIKAKVPLVATGQPAQQLPAASSASAQQSDR